MISKVPRDILHLHQLRNFYSPRRAKLRAIVLVRDPRDVLTSHHSGHARKYFQDIEEWRMLHEYCRKQKDQPDVMMIHYEDLVADVSGTQKRIEAFTGEKAERPFEEFYKAGGEGSDTRPMNGVRPVDRKGIGRWRLPEHRQRIDEVLRQAPDFAQILTELGYEPDASWIDRWRSFDPSEVG
jgi:hypothetical protein